LFSRGDMMPARDRVERRRIAVYRVVEKRRARA
jgi:hypothetical protein